MTPFKEFSKKPAHQRWRAVLTMGKSEATFTLLSNILKNDPSAIVRHDAAFILGQFQKKEAVPLLMNAIANDKSRLVRHEAIAALAETGVRSLQVKKLLRSLSKKEDSDIKDTAEIVYGTLFR